jgi:hypothetical protein
VVAAIMGCHAAEGSMEKVSVTQDDLLKGMWFAMESCGETLQAAADLFKCGHPVRAAALTLMALDELGKARLLRGY